MSGRVACRAQPDLLTRFSHPPAVRSAALAAVELLGTAQATRSVLTPHRSPSRSLWLPSSFGHSPTYSLGFDTKPQSVGQPVAAVDLSGTARPTRDLDAARIGQPVAAVTKTATSQS